MDMRFRETITTEAALRAVIGEPLPRVAAKARRKLDDKARAFIGVSPFVVIASCNGHGLLDVSPKGDKPGFVRVLDDCTLAIPDRAGNRRADTFSNILELARVALLFMVPGVAHTLRASGAATIVRDESLLADLADGGSAVLALVV